MIENKLLHYVLREDFDREKKDIADTSIAFIDEGRTIYTHGVEYNAKDVQSAIDATNSRIDSLLESLNQSLGELEDRVTTAATTKAQESLDAARALIEQLRAKLNELTEDQADANLDINKLKARITSYATYWDAVNSAVTNIRQEIDALAASILTEAQYTNIAKNQVNLYKNEVDLKLAQIEESIQNIDVESKVVSGVTTFFNALQPSWSTIVSRIGAAEQSIAALELLIGDDGSSSASLISRFATKEELENEEQERIRAVSAVRTLADSKAATADITAEFINERLNSQSMAKIIAYANNDGSGIKLNADKIDISGSTIFLNALETWVRGLNIGGSGSSGTGSSGLTQAQSDALAWLIQNESSLMQSSAYGYLRNAGIAFANTTDAITFNLTDGLKHQKVNNSSTHGYWLKNDGSGSLANGNISWTSNGVLTVNGSVVQANGSNVLTEETFEDKIKTSTVITDWVNGKVAGLTEDDKNALIADLSQRLPDLSNYALKSELPDLSTYATKAELSGYVATDELTSTIVDNNTNKTLADIVNMTQRVNAWDDPTNGFLYTTFAQKSEINDYANNMQTLSSLNTWATKIKNDYASGFSLQALVNNLTGTTSNDVSASIIGIVQDGQSSLSLSADQINLDANGINLSDVIDIDIINGEPYSTFVLGRDGMKMRVLRAAADGVIRLRTEKWNTLTGANQSINDLMTISGSWEAIQDNTHGIDVNLNGKLTARSLSLGNGNVNENALTAGDLTILGNGTVNASAMLVGPFTINNNGISGQSDISCANLTAVDTVTANIVDADNIHLNENGSISADGANVAIDNNLVVSGTATATAFVKNSNSTDILLANGNTLAQSNLVLKNSNGDISVGDVTASDVNAEEINVNGSISLGGNITFGTSGTSSYKEGYTGTVVISGQQFTFKSGILVDVSPAGQQQTEGA